MLRATSPLGLAAPRQPRRAVPLCPHSSRSPVQNSRPKASSTTAQQRVVSFTPSNTPPPHPGQPRRGKQHHTSYTPGGRFLHLVHPQPCQDVLYIIPKAQSTSRSPATPPARSSFRPSRQPQPCSLAPLRQPQHRPEGPPISTQRHARQPQPLQAIPRQHSMHTPATAPAGSPFVPCPEWPPQSKKHHRPGRQKFLCTLAPGPA